MDHCFTTEDAESSEDMEKKNQHSNKEPENSGDDSPFVDTEPVEIPVKPGGREGDSLVRWLLYIWKYRKIAVAVFLVLFLGGAAYTFLSPRYYKAKAAFFFPLASPGGGIINTLGLSGILDTSESMSGYAVSILYSAQVSNNVIDKFGDKLFGRDMKKPRIILIDQLQRIVKIKVSQSQIIEIEVETRDPKLSAEVANYYVGEYQRFSEESSLTLARQHRENMEKQRDKTRKELQGLENKLLAFQNKKKVVDPPAEIQAMLDYYSEIKSMSIISGVNYQQAESRLSAMRGKMAQQARRSDSNPDYSQMLGNQAISQLYQQIMAKEVELAKRLQTETGDNPAVKALQEEIADLRRMLRERVGSYISSVESNLTPTLIEAYSEALSQRARKQALEQVVTDLDRKFEGIPELTYSYRRLNRDILIKEKLLQYLELEVEKARSEEFKNPNEIQILDRAVPPDLYSRPILRWYLLGTVILSFLGTLMIVKMADIYNKFRAAAREEKG